MLQMLSFCDVLPGGTVNVSLCQGAATATVHELRAGAQKMREWLPVARGALHPARSADAWMLLRIHHCAQAGSAGRTRTSGPSCRGARV